MANQLNGWASIFAKESLPQLIAETPIFSAISTVFDASGTGLGAGKTITTRIPTSTYTANDTSAGINAIPASSSAVTMTLVERDITHDFSPAEWEGNEAAMLNTWLPSMVKAANKDIVVNGIAPLITAANYTGFVSSSAAAFSGSTVNNLAQKLTTNEVDSADRSLIILPTYFETLRNSDEGKVTEANYLAGYRVAQRSGFQVYEYPSIPNNSEGLSGFALHKSALALGMWLPSIPANGSIIESTDIDSGKGLKYKLVLQQTSNFRYRLSLYYMYGAAKGNGAALIRVKA